MVIRYMKIIILGGRGFIGNNLVNFFLNKDWDVEVIDSGETANTEKINNVKYYDMDLRYCDKNKIADICRYSDVVIHLASTARINPSYIEPEKYYINNVGNVANTLSALSSINYSGRIIYVSSASVYGHLGNSNIATENHPKSPLSPYGHSKLIAEQICENYRQFNRKLDIIIARPFSVYGNYMNAGDGYKTVLQIFLENYKSNKPFPISGDGSQLRDFTHVDDVCSALEYIILNSNKNETYNISNQEPVSLNDIAYKFGNWYPVEFFSTKYPDVKCTCGNNKRLKELGWQPKFKVLKWIDDTIYSINQKI